MNMCNILKDTGENVLVLHQHQISIIQ